MEGVESREEFGVKAKLVMPKMFVSDEETVEVAQMTSPRPAA